MRSQIMTKRAVDKISAGLKDAIAYVEGPADRDAFRVHVPDEVDVRAIRRRFGLSQEAFARRFGFSLGAVRDWEQHRRTPEATARALLTVLEKEPEAVRRALGGAEARP
jgi:putative transcriptional regulator